MKFHLLYLFILWGLTLTAQRDLTPGKQRNKVFGEIDLKDYRYFGLQVSGGLTYMKTRFDANDETFTTTDATGRPIDYTYNPSGKVGAFLEVGMAHFPKKRSVLSQKLKTIFVSYYDWGVGFKLLGGAENTTINYYTPTGTLNNTTSDNGSYYNGYLYGRFSLHKNISLGKKYFLDNALGANIDFRLLTGTENYTNSTAFQANTNHNPLVAQLHYGLGLGIKLSRRSFLVPSVQIPILGINEWRGGCAALKWFNSNYVPITAQLKVIYLFEKRQKGCPPARTNDDDKKRAEEFEQNN